jgi:hypothetical protein
MLQSLHLLQKSQLQVVLMPNAFRYQGMRMWRIVFLLR